MASAHLLITANYRKMALVCAKCNMSISDKYFLKCFKCKLAYDVECSGKPPKLFPLMSTESKKAWACLSCRSASNAPNETSSKKGILLKNSNGKTMTKNIPKNVSAAPSMSSVAKELDKAKPSFTQHQQIESDKSTLNSVGQSPQDRPAKGKIPTPLGNCQSANSTPSQEHITLRKPMQLRQALAPESEEEPQAKNSASEISLESMDRSHDSDDLNAESMQDTYDQNRSCPVITAATSETMAEYKNNILNLELRLQTAEHEIENLILENGTLRKQIQDNELTIKNLTRICTSTSKKSKKHPSKKNLTSLKCDLNHTDENDFSKTNANLTVQSLSHASQASRKNSQGRQKISSSKSDVLHKELPRQECERINTSTPIKRNSAPTASNDEAKLQLCIISNQKSNYILNAVDYVFDRNVRYCHYVTPNSSITELLSNLEEKLVNFTMDDYCIIYIGEQDINRNDNIIEFINNIRESLKKITHTNKIICLPTYVCGALIYNYQVELFGNLLAMDMQSNDYAYLFDTNRNLTLDMFSNYSGKITKFGIKSAFASLKKFILNLKDVFVNESPANNSACDTKTMSPQIASTAKVPNAEFFRASCS